MVKRITQLWKQIKRKTDFLRAIRKKWSARVESSLHFIVWYYKVALNLRSGMKKIARLRLGWWCWRWQGWQYATYGAASFVAWIAAFWMSFATSRFLVFTTVCMLNIGYERARSEVFHFIAVKICVGVKSWWVVRGEVQGIFFKPMHIMTSPFSEWFLLVSAGSVIFWLLLIRIHYDMQIMVWCYRLSILSSYSQSKKFLSAN